MTHDTYVILGELPIEAFHDEPVREFYWEQMRTDAHRRIPQERKGWRIGDPEYDHRDTFFGRYVPISDNPDDGMALWPCPEEEAEVGVMRLVVRAIPPMPWGWRTPNGQAEGPETPYREGAAPPE